MKYIVTGASSGLGYALCTKLLCHGDVAGMSRTIRKTKSIAGNFNYKHIKCDLSNPLSLRSGSNTCMELEDFIGDDDVSLILNAAAFYRGDERLNFNDLEKIFHINIISPFKLTNFIQKFSLRRILFINSISGLIGQDTQHEYASTKHALMGFSKSLSKSAKHSSFDVMTINPGGMKTELWKEYPDVNTSDFLDTSTVADICEKLLSIPGRVFIENFTILPPSDVN